MWSSWLRRSLRQPRLRCNSLSLYRDDSHIGKKKLSFLTQLMLSRDPYRLQEEVLILASLTGQPIIDKNNLPVITARALVGTNCTNFHLALEVLEFFDEWRPKTMILGLYEFIDRCLEYGHVDDAMQAYHRLRNTGRNLDIPAAQRLIHGLAVDCRIDDLLEVVRAHAVTDDIMVCISEPLIMSGRMNAYAEIFARYLTATSTIGAKLRSSTSAARVIRSLMHARLRRIVRGDNPRYEEISAMKRIFAIIENYHVKLSTVGGVVDPSSSPSYFQFCQLYEAEKGRLSLEEDLDLTYEEECLVSMMPMFEKSKFPYLLESSVQDSVNLQKENVSTAGGLGGNSSSSSGGGDNNRDHGTRGEVDIYLLPVDLTMELDCLRTKLGGPKVDNILYRKDLFPLAYEYEMRLLHHKMLHPFLLYGSLDMVTAQKESLIGSGLDVDGDNGGNIEDDDEDFDDDDDDDGDDDDDDSDGKDDDDDDGDDDDVDSLETYLGDDNDDDDDSVTIELTLPREMTEGEGDIELRRLIDKMNHAGCGRAASLGLIQGTGPTKGLAVNDLTMNLESQLPPIEVKLTEDLFSGEFIHDEYDGGGMQFRDSHDDKITRGSRRPHNPDDLGDGSGIGGGGGSVLRKDKGRHTVPEGLGPEHSEPQ